jgi:membrane protease YdiL (CAAX protease family)
MRIARIYRSLKVSETLLIYLSTIFAWELIFHSLYKKFDNVSFLAWAGTAISIYCIAKYLLRPDFFGSLISFSHAPEIFFVSVVTVLVGIGSWSLLVYIDASLNGPLVMERWGLIPVRDFREMKWSKPWLIGNLMVSVLLVPIIEEIVFRGLILQRLRERYSCLFSLIVSAGIFAIFHYDKSFLGVFVHGVIFAVLAIRMSSIYAPIIVHCLFNLTAFILSTFAGFSVVANRESLSDFTYWTTELLCGLAGTILLLVYFFGVLEKGSVKLIEK